MWGSTRAAKNHRRRELHALGAAFVWLALGAWACGASNDPQIEDLNLSRPPPQRGEQDGPAGDAGGDGSPGFETDGEPHIEAFAYWSTPDGHVPTYFAHLMGGAMERLVAARIVNPSQAPRTVVAYADVEGFTKTRGSRVVELGPGETKTRVNFGPELDLEKIGAASGATPTKLLLSLYTTGGERLYETVKSVDMLPKGRVFDQVFEDAKDRPEGERARQLATVVMTTPNDRWGEISKLVKEVVSYAASRSMPSYKTCASQTTDESKRTCLLSQFEAIYETLRARGMSVSKPPSDFYSSGREVQYPAETLRANKGNPFEVALVMGSALEAMGLDPGYQLVAQHTFPFVRVANASFTSWISYPADPTRLRESSFDDAQESATLIKREAAKQGDPWHSGIILATWRKGGYTPAPFP